MNPAIIYNVFMRDFRKQRKRITLTLIALGWGTISIMLLLGFGQGLNDQMTINQKGMGDGIVILWGGQSSIPYKGLGKGRPIRFELADIDYLRRSIPEMEYVGGEYANWGVVMKHGTSVVSDHLSGITPNYEDMRSHIPQMGGRMINDLDCQLKRRVCFIGAGLKKRLFGDEDAVGQTVMVSGIPFTVVGVEIEKMQMNSYSGQDTDKMSIPITTFKAIFGYRFLNVIIYKPKTLDNMKGIQARVYEVMGAKYKFDPKDERAIWVWDVVESQKQFNNIMLGLQIFLGIIGGLTLLIAGVGVANIMYVSIKERTREIGIKMAVGARRSYIMAQFLIEALLITFLGGFGGMGVSYVLTEAFKKVPMKSEVLDFMGRPTISPEIGVIVVVILGVMGILSGFFPALRAASVSPVESLRYE